MKENLKKVQNVAGTIIILGCLWRGIYEFEKALCLASFKLVDKISECTVRAIRNRKEKRA